MKFKNTRMSLAVAAALVSLPQSNHSLRRRNLRLRKSLLLVRVPPVDRQRIYRFLWMC